METIRGDSGRGKTAKSLKERSLQMKVHREPETQGIRNALQALHGAYAKAAGALSARLQDKDCGVAELSYFGSSYGWVTDRQRLVNTFLSAEPAVIAYASNELGHPEQIRSLAEAATELAAEGRTLSSALGLLNYIERELGWASIGGAPVGNA